MRKIGDQKDAVEGSPSMLFRYPDSLAHSRGKFVCSLFTGQRMLRIPQTPLLRSPRMCAHTSAFLPHLSSKKNKKKKQITALPEAVLAAGLLLVFVPFCMFVSQNDYEDDEHSVRPLSSSPQSMFHYVFLFAPRPLCVM